MVGVVKKDHVAGLQVARRASRDALRRRELAPVLAPAGPEEWLHAALPDGSQSRFAVDAERGPMEPALADDFDGAAQVGLNCGNGEPGHHSVAVTVDPHFMAAPFHLGCEIREALALLADQEEDRLGARLVEGVEDRRRALRVRPVIERERRERPVEA